ncbi:response regulator [Geobacter sp. OR-1]|uniref:hybrid sensor histidine kinase/response regulator n=1 Tax=Geobacter sp. OR-1 TaxID=1266765 RepID=UPI0005A66DEB|nr:response regulator [Geobacter sp. OR-1]
MAISFQKSIKSQLFVIIFIVAVPAMGIIFYSGFHSRQMALDDAQNTTRKLVDRIATEQQNLVVGAEQLMTALAQLPEVKNRDAARVEPVLKKLRTLNPMYSNIFIADRSGAVWATAVPTPPPFVVADRRYFKRALASGQLSSGEYVVSRATSKPAFNLAYPLKDDRGETIGIISVGFIIDKYRELLSRLDLPAGTSFVLIDHRGMILSRALEPEKFIGKPYIPDYFKQMQEGPEAGTSIRPGLAGDRRIISYQKLLLPGEEAPYLYITAGIPLNAVTEAAFRSLVYNVTAFMLFLGAACYLAWLIGKHSITDRIAILKNAAERLSHGDLDIRVSSLVVGGELGDLSQAFDMMANQLAMREQSLQENKDLLAEIIELSPISMAIVSIDGTIEQINRRAIETFGYLPDDIPNMERWWIQAYPDESYRAEVIAQWMGLVGKAMTEKSEIERREYRVTCKDGTVKTSLIFGIPVSDKVFVIFDDITDRKRAEEERLSLERQLLQSQKMESLGVLAGGIAHDFNNILTAIVGNTELALMRLNPESPVLDNLKRIENGAIRATDLAKQMLAYSGKGKFVVEAIDLNRLVEEMGHMLDVSISKKAILRFNLTKPLPSLEADATQIRQVIMNLVINASEAIGDKSGVITVTTGCVSCDRNYLNTAWLNSEIPEGLYVFLEVADTGCGMDRETQAKMFDPFFTTKFTGRGLGMAAVQGIVRGHKGAMNVYSEAGNGSRFKLLFPAGAKTAEQIEIEPHKNGFSGEGTILLVDDEETVRAIGTEILNELGFAVVTANDGREAIDLFKANPDVFCVVLDLTMPHMDGEQTFRELRLIDPNVKVIMSSGYSEYEVTQKFAGKGLSGFVQKPYKISSFQEVLEKV